MARPRKNSSHLNKDIIYETALRLLHLGGEHSLSYRLLAKELNVTAMAIKHHVGTRQELLQSLVEKTFAPIGSNDQKTKSIQGLLMDYCSLSISHPNLMICILSNAALMTKQLQWLTSKLEESLVEFGVPEDEQSTLLGLIVDYTHGFALSAAMNEKQRSEGNTLLPALTIEDYTGAIDWILSKNVPSSPLNNKTTVEAN